MVGFPKAVLEGAKRKVKEFENASNEATGTVARSSNQDVDGGGGGGGGGSSLSPLPPSSKQQRGGAITRMSDAERARVTKFISDFRALDKSEVVGGNKKAHQLIAAFRRECRMAGSDPTSGLASLLRPRAGSVPAGP